MKQTLESPTQLIHTTARVSKEQPRMPVIKVEYPFSTPLANYIKEMVKLTILGLNKAPPTFKLSDEYPKCTIYAYKVNITNIVVKYRIA